MLSEQDVTKIRQLKDDLDQEEKDLSAAIRETENAKVRLKQVRSSIRPAARTRFTAWLTNSDPEEHRRYRAAIAEHKDQIQLVHLLKPKVAAKDARIDAAVEECLKRSDQTYQEIMTQHQKANRDQEYCEQLRARSSQLRGQVDAALTQLQQLSDPKEARKAAKLTAAQISEGVHILKKELVALASRMRAYDSFSIRHIQNLRTEVSGGRANVQTRRTELTSIRATLSTIHGSLTSASKHIKAHKRDLDRRRNAIVQQARAQALGS